MNIILQVIISVIVVYLIFSVIVYVIVEGIASLFQLRGKALLNALNRLIGNSQLRGLLYQHPQINKIRRDKRLPAYIPSSNVATAIIDLVKNGNVAPATPGLSPLNTSAIFNAYQQGLAQMPVSELKQLLQTVTDHTVTLQELKDALEKWYNDYMDRVTGWYKKQIRKVVIAVSLIVTIVFNVDSLHIIREASINPVFRERMNLLADQLLTDSLIIARVEAERKTGAADTTAVGSITPTIVKQVPLDSLSDAIRIRQQEYTALQQKMTEWNLPVGHKVNFRQLTWPVIIGWVITVFALSAGAPFWFDLLKRVVNLRNAGLKPSGSVVADQRM